MQWLGMRPGADFQQMHAESLPDECPWCSNPTESGYGLMGGGCGAYVFCTDEACDFFAKQQDRE